MADGEAPRDADAYVFLSWDYFNSFATSRPKFHLDGGVTPVASNAGIEGEKHPPMRRHVVFAGGLGPHAGAELLARAFHRLPDRNVELLLLGKGRNAAIEELARRDKRIRMLGHVREEDLENICENAAVFVNPRPCGYGPNRVNFPSKLLTYLAFGKPVISTRCPGLSPAYEDVLTFLAREDENCLADTLREVLAWPAARLVAVRQRIAAFAESHTWLEQAGRLLAWMATVSR
jgi:glycosyltransferase involved in cell wall biosynthesis